MWPKLVASETWHISKFRFFLLISDSPYYGFENILQLVVRKQKVEKCKPEESKKKPKAPNNSFMRQNYCIE